MSPILLAAVSERRSVEQLRYQFMFSEVSYRSSCVAENLSCTSVHKIVEYFAS